MSLSPDQREQRLEGITATDIAAIVGCHPFRTKLDVFLEKNGQTKPFEGNRRSYWGEILEPMIREQYGIAHGVYVEQVGTIVHPDYPWWMATPDGIVFQSGSRTPDRGLEIKVHSRDAVFFGGLEYGAPGTDEVPVHELLQCAWGIGASKLDRWDLVPFLDGAPEEYVIDRDEELLEMLRDEAERFRADHLATGNPPPPDGSKAWDAYLKRSWKQNLADLVDVNGNADVIGLLDQLRGARAAAAEHLDIANVITQQLKLVIGNNAGIQFTEDGRGKPSKVTWKFSKPRVKQDWRALTAEMREIAALTSSGTAQTIERLLICLQSIGTDTVGRSTRAVITATEAAAAILAIRDALVTIVKAPIDKHETPMAAARPFNVPRHWKKIDTNTDDDKEG